jgi:hypothetical protein
MKSSQPGQKARWYILMRTIYEQWCILNLKEEGIPTLTVNFLCAVALVFRWGEFAHYDNKVGGGPSALDQT